MPEIIGGNDQVSAGWLTAILRSDSALPHGDVATVEERPKSTSFPADLRSLYENALAGLQRAWGRYLADRVTRRRDLTLSNGDSYFAQFLCPNNPAGTTYLIDFQSPKANFAALDLVYLSLPFGHRLSDRGKRNGCFVTTIARFRRMVCGMAGMNCSWTTGSW